jgi:hypothetical protein
VPSVEVLSTTVSPRHRTIHLLLESGDTDRYALVRRPNGDVHWSLDTFTREHPGDPWQWAGHTGRLTVAEVLAQIPGCRRDVVRWTHEELEDGPDAVDVDIFARDVRRRALERLGAELAALPPEA